MPPVSSGAWLLPLPIFAPDLAVPFSATCKLIETKLRTASLAGKVLVLAEAQESGWADLTMPLIAQDLQGGASLGSPQGSGISRGTGACQRPLPSLTSFLEGIERDL